MCNARPRPVIILALLGCAAVACSLPVEAAAQPTATSTPAPTPASTPTLTPVPTATAFPQGWQPLLPGLDLRFEMIPIDGLDFPAQALVLRVDPARYTFRMSYTPGRGAKVSTWHAQMGALVTLNGGFFLPDKTTLGLIVSDGQPYGQTFAATANAGMLAEVEGSITLRSLGQFPYDASEPLDQAVQGRPMLLYPGRYPVEFSLPTDLSRRTAVAQDGAGTLYFIVVDGPLVSLYDLRDWLATSDIADFWVAFNLDGGGSTGVAITAGDFTLSYDSINIIPSVISIYPR